MSHPSPLPSPPSPPPPKPDVLRGWIKTMRDAILVLEATRVGIVPRVTRRFHELEKRSIIQSGAILVFTEEESGIKRWTDPYLWSASRMQGSFLMYREREDEKPSDGGSPYRCSAIAPLLGAHEDKVDAELERYILGSWNKGKGLKKNGLMKKTISMAIEDTMYHLISYYYPSDVRSGLLQTPSSMPKLASLEISPAITRALSQFRQPPALGKAKRGKTTRSSRDLHSSNVLLDMPLPPSSSPHRIAQVSSDIERRSKRHSSTSPRSIATSSSRSSPHSRPRASSPETNTPSVTSPSHATVHPPDNRADACSIAPSSESPAAFDEAAFDTQTHTPLPVATSAANPAQWAVPQSYSSSALYYDYDYDYVTSSLHPGLHVVSSTPSGVYGHASPDPHVEQLIRSQWEPVFNEATVMTSSAGDRPTPYILPSSAYYMPPMYY